MCRDHHGVILAVGSRVELTTDESAATLFGHFFFETRSKNGIRLEKREKEAVSLKEKSLKIADCAICRAGKG